MVKNCLRLFLLLTAWSCAVGEEAPRSIHRMALGEKSSIYAVSGHSPDRIFIYENGTWSGFSASQPFRGSPIELCRLHDGRVAALWQTSESQWMLTILQGKQVVKTLPFSWSPRSRARMTGDSKGNIWLLSETPEVLRCHLDSGVWHTFDLRSYFDSTSKKEWNALHFLEDQRGNQWLWCANTASNYFAMIGLVKVEGDKLTAPIAPAGFEWKRLLQVAVRDKNSLWLLSRQNGQIAWNLMALNLDTHALEEVPGLWPPPFRHTPMGLLPICEGWLLPVNGGIWQWDHGKWRERLPEDTANFATWYNRVPSYTELDSGVLMALTTGLLFLPNEGEAKILDWSQGWNMDGVTQLLPLGGDRFMASASSGVRPPWVQANIADFLKEKPLAEIVEISPWSGWAVDKQDRVFTFLEKKATHLSVWENKAWRKIPLPDNLNTSFSYHLKLDTQERLWVFPDTDDDMPVAILSSDLKTWETAPDYRTALVRQGQDLEGFAEDLDWLRPITGPHGQIAFRTHNWKIMHWDGQQWNTWTLTDINSSGKKGDRVSTPFFDEEGRLCVNTLYSDFTQKLEKNRTWVSTAKQPGPKDKWTENTAQTTSLALPDDFRPHNLNARGVATDNLGRVWAVGDSTLFKYYKGRTVRVFDDTKLHPFIKNPSISTVRVDRFGDTWIQVGPHSTHHVRLPAQPVSTPELTLLVDKSGLATLQSLPQGMIEWRWGEGEWMELAPGERDLGFIPAEIKAVEFRIFNEQLDFLGLITKKVAIKISPAEQRAHWIEVLQTGPDIQRNFAIESMASQPEKSIPALEKALTKSNSWWLQAALQECQRRL